MSRGLVGVALLLLAAGAAGCGEHSSATKLKIEMLDGNGVQAYTLRCDPPSGSAPDPGAICTELGREPKLLVGGRAFDHSCPGGDYKAFRVSGTYRGYKVDANFPPESCAWVPGQDGAPAEWSYLMHNAGVGTPERQLGGTTALDAAMQRKERKVARQARRIEHERSKAIRSGALLVRQTAPPDPLALAFLRAQMREENLTGPEIFDGRVYSTTRKRLERRFGFWTSAARGPLYFVVFRYAFRDYAGRRHVADDTSWVVYDGRTLAVTDVGGGGNNSPVGFGPSVLLRP